MPRYIRIFYIYKEIAIPRTMNNFMQHLNLNFHLALENIDNRAFITLAECDDNNSINWECPKTGLHRNTLL